MPIAQIGSYAIIIFSLSSSLIFSTAANNSLINTSLTFPDTLSSLVSPIHNIGIIPFSNKLFTFLFISSFDSF